MSALAQFRALPSTRHYAAAASTRRPYRNDALTTIRPAVLGVAKLLLLPLASAAPVLLHVRDEGHEHDKLPLPVSDPDLWIYLTIALALVLLGGVFAGLTIAMMGQDETYLQVIANSGEGSEKAHAVRVLNMLKKGKHWILVTLLLSNVITNETLPIVLDRSLGGGYAAVVLSTVLIVIFGEVLPQSACVRYGLSIGAYCAPFVTILMYILSPVGWPTAKALDWMLGEDHGTRYKKAGLKTLVTLHKTLPQAAREGLIDDEVTIITSVLDLKEKPVGDIMTPMQDVFIMSADTVLDERMMNTILSQGYSRIPIYAPENPRNFIGMLLVKILITYDPEDCKRVRDFALATLPETAPYTSCLDIINFFQEGKSHMVLVSDFPGQDKGALGVVTLEDVIEELIGEEIIDESDVFVDVHKAIRRMAPAPKTRFNSKHFASDFVVSESEDERRELTENEPLLRHARDGSDGASGHDTGYPSAQTTFLMRKSSAGSEPTRELHAQRPVAVRSSATDMRQHLKFLGPSNAASKPRSTKFSNVKIKPGVETIAEHRAMNGATIVPSTEEISTGAELLGKSYPNGVTVDKDTSEADSLRMKNASGGVAAVYGTMGPASNNLKAASGAGESKLSAMEASRVAEENASRPPTRQEQDYDYSDQGHGDERSDLPEKLVVGKEEYQDDDVVGELANSSVSPEWARKRMATRSGSITETHVEAGGLRKVVLETTSSSEEGDSASLGSAFKRSPLLWGASKDVQNEDESGDYKEQTQSNGDVKKRRKKRGKKKKATADSSSKAE